MPTLNQELPLSDDLETGLLTANTGRIRYWESRLIPAIATHRIEPSAVNAFV